MLTGPFPNLILLVTLAAGEPDWPPEPYNHGNWGGVGGEEQEADRLCRLRTDSNGRVLCSGDFSFANTAGLNIND